MSSATFRNNAPPLAVSHCDGEVRLISDDASHGQSQAPKLDMFGIIERVHGDAPWGSVLDAGTGMKSARWLASLPSTQWTAVSADAEHLQIVENTTAHLRRRQDRCVLGNWQDPALLEGEKFDTIVAEYLLGAVESYAPYFQSDLFPRLKPLIGGRVYIVGVDPYVLGAKGNASGSLVMEIGQLRDACALLAGVTPYREYPAEWVVRQLNRIGLKVIFARRFPNSYNAAWAEAQLFDVCRLIELIEHRDVALAMKRRTENLRANVRQRLSNGDNLVHGSDYLIAATA